MQSITTNIKYFTKCLLGKTSSFKAITIPQNNDGKE